MRKAFSLFTVLTLVLLTASSVTAGEVTFHDARTKLYNDNGFPKLMPESPLTLETTFSVDEKKEIYFKLEASEENMPYAEPSGWRVRTRLLNDTWSYTDLGQFGDGADLTAPTNPYTVVPGHNYTVQLIVTFDAGRVTTSDAYEISVVMGVRTGKSYNPSDSITHIVQFAEEPSVVRKPSEPFPWLWILAGAALFLAAVYGLYRRKRPNEEED